MIINEFELIYKKYRNMEERKYKIKELENQGFYLEDKKEYTDNILRIFRKKFVIHNKNKCQIIYKDKIYNIKEYFEDIDNNSHQEDLIKLKLTGIKNIKDLSYMFYGCFQLIEISIPKDTKKTNQIDTTFESNDFYQDCKLPLYPNKEIKLDTTNIKETTDLYNECNGKLFSQKFYSG